MAMAPPAVTTTAPTIRPMMSDLFIAPPNVTRQSAWQNLHSARTDHPSFSTARHRDGSVFNCLYAGTTVVAQEPAPWNNWTPVGAVTSVLADRAMEIANNNSAA